MRRDLFEAEEDRYICPAGKTLHYQGHWERAGVTHYKYQAGTQECANCSLRAQCCVANQKHGRSVERKQENPALAAFREKMASEKAQAIYRRRGPVAEFVHAWIKTKFGLRQFHVRGLNKVRAEMLWACFTYNMQQWIRLGPAPDPSAAG